jgi:DUF1365 family protein
MSLYIGDVTHHRLRPVRHALRYRLFMLLLDLDEAPKLRLFRAGLVSFRQRDHGDGTPCGLRAWVDRHLAEAGLPTGGALRVLCMPRVLGMAFNPLSVFFCHAPDGTLAALLYEVNNTFGERHSYLMRVREDAPVISHCCDKRFHVSPFMDMDLRYRFRVIRPAGKLGVFISVSDSAGAVLAAGFTAREQPLTDATLARAVLAMPLLGARVVAGIHWEAAKLWLKGLTLRPAASRPAGTVTIAP